jgi:AcrR family transcriptional regulator
MRSRLSVEQEAALLETALKLVEEVGYDLASIDEIARRAHASKATLYRRWKSKADLVFAALLQRSTSPHEEGFGASLRDDFIRGLSGLCANATAAKDLIVGLTPAIHSNPELWRLVREQFLRLEQKRSIEALERAVARGEIRAVPGDIMTIVEVAVAMTYHRMLLLRAPLDADFVAYVVDAILIPLVDAQLTRSSPRAAARPGSPQDAVTRAARASPRSPPEARPAARKRRSG